MLKLDDGHPTLPRSLSQLSGGKRSLDSDQTVLSQVVVVVAVVLVVLVVLVVVVLVVVGG